MEPNKSMHICSLPSLVKKKNQNGWQGKLCAVFYVYTQKNVGKVKYP